MRVSLNRHRFALWIKALLIASVTAAIGANALSARTASAASAAEINRNVAQSLTTLYQTTPGAKAWAEQAKAVLVFVKGGFIIAGQYGDGALRKRKMHRSSGSLGYIWYAVRIE
jgi:lipid-binding SYLF domain-containing protein